MIRKSFVFLFLILFVCSLLYSATTNQQGSNSGSSTLGKPSVKFRDSTVSIVYRESTADD